MSKFSAKFRLKGVTPLLMHADDVNAATQLAEWRKDPANKNVSEKGDDRSPPWTWMTYLYVDDAGNVTMPADNVMVALRQAGAKIPLKGNKTFKEATQSGLLITDSWLTFTNNGEQVSAANLAGLKDEPFREHIAATERDGFGLLVKRAKVGQAKHVRVRPIFNAWAVEGTVTVLSSDITLETLKQLFTLAGDVGLCDWRPGCKTPGSYGMFESVVSKA